LSFYDAALKVIAMGIPVFPCVPGRKNPLTPRGFLQASTDEATVRQWAQQWPDANLAIPTGLTSGLIVLDVDRDEGKDGEAELAKLTAMYGDLPPTLQARTPRGGLHLFWKSPGQKLQCRTNYPAPSLDVRADGGYVVIAPSVTERGRYAWTRGGSPADCPPWLLDILLHRGNAVAERVEAEARETCSEPVDSSDEKRIRKALQFIRADDYDTWIKIGMAIHSKYSNVLGFLLWDDWSRTAPHKYDKCESQKKWDTFKRRAGGVTLGTLFDYAKRGGWMPEPDPLVALARRRRNSAAALQDQHPVKPVVVLPHGEQTISETGRILGALLAETEDFFVRGGAVVKLVPDADGFPRLEDIKPATLASDFESVAELFTIRVDRSGIPKMVPAVCPENIAKLIAASGAFREAMRLIRVLTRCPVLIERAGRLVQISGYDRESGILAAGEMAETMDLAEARRLLGEMLAGFRFATPGDRARALAALITPAFIFSGLVKNLRAPVDLGEANASQTGKGYRNKLTAALYSQTVKTVTQQRAGVGSMEESFNMALIRGANFIAIDNVRGKIDSPSFESFLTEDTYLARAPFREPVEIDPRRVIIMLTSNKANLTPDLANRAACVRLMRQPEGHVFANYPEGDILEHVRAHHARYLGAVFAIVRAWHEAGKPRTAETRHDFRPWAQTLDWITRNLLDAGPLLDGHRETQERMTNPTLNWLRDVAIQMIRAQRCGKWLRASAILDLTAESEAALPGYSEMSQLEDPEMRKSAQQKVGRRMAICFGENDILSLDGMTVERRIVFDPAARYDIREYQFSAAADEPSAPVPPAAAASRPPSGPAGDSPESTRCGYGAADGAADESADETRIAANAADASAKSESRVFAMEEDGVIWGGKAGVSRIAAVADTALEEEDEFYP
jgi:hypothetical protein